MPKTNRETSQNKREREHQTNHYPHIPQFHVVHLSIRTQHSSHSLLLSTFDSVSFFFGLCLIRKRLHFNSPNQF